MFIDLKTIYLNRKIKIPKFAFACYVYFYCNDRNPFNLNHKRKHIVGYIYICTSTHYYINHYTSVKLTKLMLMYRSTLEKKNNRFIQELIADIIVIFFVLSEIFRRLLMVQINWFELDRIEFSPVSIYSAVKYNRFIKKQKKILGR